MLILARKMGESLIIGDGVEVTVLNIKGHQVKLGIRAPKHIDVYRDEIYRKIQNGLVAEPIAAE